MTLDDYRLLKTNIVLHPIIEEEYELKHYYLSIIYLTLTSNSNFGDKEENLINIYLEGLGIEVEDYDKISGLTLPKDKSEIEFRLKKLSKLYFEFAWLYINFKSYKYILIADIIYFNLLSGYFEENKEYINSIRKKLKIKNRDYSNIFGFLKKLRTGDLSMAKIFFEDKLSKSKFSMLNYFLDKSKKSLKEKYKEEHRVLILATMSAGKSTLINSLLGQELLPVKNLACTAKTMKIVQNPNFNNFIGYSLKIDKQKTIKGSVDNQIIEFWNEEQSIDYIYLEGNIPVVADLEKKVTLIDTPGSNSCIYEEHRQVTNEVIRQERFDELIYILDATQLATDDDQEFLHDLFKVCAEKKFNIGDIKFVVNKLDKLDLEAGECIKEILEEAKEFLVNLGIADPIIIPTSAYAAKLFNSVLAGEYLSRKESLDLKFLHSIFNSDNYNLSNYFLNQMQEQTNFNAEGIKDKIIKIGKEEYESKSILKAFSNTGIQELLMTLNISRRN